MRFLKIYLASSWRNRFYDNVLNVLRMQGYKTYDFKHPENNEISGFSWDKVDKEFENWTCNDFKERLHHPEAIKAFKKTSMPCKQQTSVFFFCHVAVLLILKLVG